MSKNLIDMIFLLCIYSICSPLSPGEFDDDIEAMTFTKGKVEGLIAHEQYEIETRGGMSIIVCVSSPTE